MKVKFCGCRREEDVSFCNVCLPDYMGMILSPGFRRSISVDMAQLLLAKKDPAIQSVGVFVNMPPEDIANLLEFVPVDGIQLHGNETAADITQLRVLTEKPIWKAARIQSKEDIFQADRLGADMLVLEGYSAGIVGGGGITADWNLIASNPPNTPFFLAGGLNPENVSAAIQSVHPDGVDCSSGIESDGVKDFQKMKQMIQRIRGESL